MALDLRQNFVSVQYLRNKWTELHQISYMHSFCQHLLWDVTHHFSHICTRVMNLDFAPFPLNIVRTNVQILTNFYITIYTDKFYFGIGNCHFSHIYTSVMALDFTKVSFQFNILRKKDRISPNYIYALILTISNLGLLHIIFAHLYQSYGPWFAPKIDFRSISGEQMDRFLPNFI